MHRLGQELQRDSGARCGMLGRNNMPRVIRQALGERIRESAELRKFLEDFRGATGVMATYVAALGAETVDEWRGGGALGARLEETSEGRVLRRRFQQKLLEAAVLQPATREDEAGLMAAAVPIRTAGQTVGYLAIGGYFSEPVERAQVNRARHLLSRAGVGISAGELEELMRAAPVISRERQAALVNVLQLAVEHLTAKLTERWLTPGEGMPAIVEQACRLVHAEFAQPVSVPDIAQRLGVSEGHLSRTFHHATGLRLIEYVARFRAERARALIRETGRPIEEIAHACGFQSLSQFNRVFRAQFDERPSDLR